MRSAVKQWWFSFSVWLTGRMMRGSGHVCSHIWRRSERASLRGMAWLDVEVQSQECQVWVPVIAIMGYIRAASINRALN